MALIKCIECNKEFSDKAEACPNCGCPTSDIMNFPFKTEKEKQGYEHYLSFLQKNNNTYTWKVCCDCGCTLQLHAWNTPITSEFLKEVDKFNSVDVCDQCGSKNLYATEHMPFPMIHTNVFAEYDHICKTYGQLISGAGELWIAPEDRKEPSLNELNIAHPIVVISNWEDNFPEDLKKTVQQAKDKAVKEFEALKQDYSKIQSTPNPTPKKDEVTCPKCGSTQIQMVQRKWSLLSGFMTNKVDRVCVKCKHKF